MRRAGAGGHRRAAILFEVLLAIALFVGAAAFTLAASRSVLTAIDTGRREQLALDLARSTLSELEAGLISYQDLRDGERRTVGSLEDFDPSGGLAASGEPRWVFDIDTARTEHRGLSLVTLTVREEADGAPDRAGSRTVSVTLRQLMRLRQQEAAAFEEDALIEGLPEQRP